MGYKVKIPISYLTMGRNLEKDIQLARPDYIAKYLLMHGNNTNFQELRKLAVG